MGESLLCDGCKFIPCRRVFGFDPYNECLLDILRIRIVIEFRDNVIAGFAVVKVSPGRISTAGNAGVIFYGIVISIRETQIDLREISDYISESEE